MNKILTFALFLLPISSFSPLPLRHHHYCNRKSDDVAPNRKSLPSHDHFLNLVGLRHVENESSVKSCFLWAPRQRMWFSSFQASLSSSSCAEDAIWYHVPNFSASNLDVDATSIEESRLLRSCDAVITAWSIGADDGSNNGGSNESIQNDFKIRGQSHRWIRHMKNKDTGDLVTSQQKRQHDSRRLHDSDFNVSLKRITPSLPPMEALEAMEATYRWASNFVRPLHLCPWAGSSLDTPGAMRYWVVLLDSNEDSNDNESNMMEVQRQRIIEKAVREAGIHLRQITSSSDGNLNDENAIDPSVAISFVIIVPRVQSPSTLSSSPLPSMDRSILIDILQSFDSFYEFFLDLEDRLLDECDNYWDETEENNIDDRDSGGLDGNSGDTAKEAPIGCEITIAAFHPDWRFSAADCDGGSNDGENDIIEREGTVSTDLTTPIDFEKKTPFPTISIVMSSAIDALMKDRDEQQQQHDRNSTDINAKKGDMQSNPARNSSNSAPITEKIASVNEKTLNMIGTEKLFNLFERDVLQCPRVAKKMDRIDPDSDQFSGI
ncbi:hypothetical protein ACHAXS_005681 [Conticribra weissflogii]